MYNSPKLFLNSKYSLFLFRYFHIFIFGSCMYVCVCVCTQYTCIKPLRADNIMIVIMFIQYMLWFGHIYLWNAYDLGAIYGVDTVKLFQYYYMGRKNCFACGLCLQFLIPYDDIIFYMLLVNNLVLSEISVCVHTPQIVVKTRLE